MSDFKGRHFEGEIVLWGGALVLPLRRELSRSGADYGRARHLGRPFDDLPLGSAVCARNRETAALAVARTMVDQLAGQ